MTSRYNHAQNGSLNFVVQKNVIFVVKTLIQIFTKNMTITYTFVATNRAKKIAYGVGRDRAHTTYSGRLFQSEMTLGTKE